MLGGSSQKPSINRGALEVAVSVLTPSLAGEEEAELGDRSPVYSREFASEPGQGQEPC